MEINTMIIYEVVRCGLSKAELSKAYIQKIIELYKITKILKSGVCSNYEGYRNLFIKKSLELINFQSELKTQINMDPEKLNEYMPLFYEYIDKILSLVRYSNNKEDAKRWIQIKKDFSSSDYSSIIKAAIIDCFSTIHGTTLNFDKEMSSEIIDSLTEKQIQEMMLLDPDKELKQIIDSGVYKDVYEHDYYGKMAQDSGILSYYCPYVEREGFASSSFLNFRSEINNTFHDCCYNYHLAKLRETPNTPKM